MKLIRGFYNLRPEHRGCVATIGNFDGVHRGHQAILQQLHKQAEQFRVPALVICFEPQPQEYFQPENPPSRLTRLREKLFYFHQQGIEQVLCLPFNKRLEELSAREFVQRIKQCVIHSLVIGHDFRFGANRKGDITLLRKMGIDVKTVEPITADKIIVSSTHIRGLLANGDLMLAENFLGHPYILQGRVIHGDKRGRTLGYPTANIYFGSKRPPLTGVFAVYVHGIGKEKIAGVANLGIRPTVGGSRTLLEVVLLNFNQDIYGQHIQIEFIHRLREEQKFDSLALLKAQIEQDIQKARAFFQ